MLYVHKYTYEWQKLQYSVENGAVPYRTLAKRSGKWITRRLFGGAVGASSFGVVLNKLGSVRPDQELAAAFFGGLQVAQYTKGNCIEGARPTSFGHIQMG